MVTIKDVANRVGVSTATVSHVINNTRFVSDALKQRVQGAVRELKYQPNGIARSLVKKRTHTLGIIISDILNPFYTAIVRGVEDSAQKNGYNVILCNTDEDPEKESLYIHILLEKRVDGLIISSTFSEGTHPFCSELSKIPLVSIVRKMRGLRGDAVAGDNTGGAYQAVRHLIDSGHRRVGIISGPPGLSSAFERLEGCRKALDEARIPLDPHLIKYGDFRRESGYHLTKEFIVDGDAPTALFVTNNQMTLGALMALGELKKKVPQEVSLISFDDPGWYSFLNPPMTTVEHSPYRMGKTAGELLLQRVQNKRKRSRTIVIPSRLITRASVSPPSAPGRP